MTLVLGAEQEGPSLKRPRLEPVQALPPQSISSDPIVGSESLDRRFRLARARARTNKVPLVFMSGDAERDRALQTWLLIVRANPLSSPVGKLMDSILSDPKLSEQEKSSKTLNLIADVVAGKATSTLQDRADFILHYLKWSNSKDGYCTIPFVEAEVYEYIDVVLKGKAPTTADRFLQALRFAGGVFEIEGGIECANSRRVKGSALSCLLKKRPKQQADELTEMMVSGLEFYLRDGERDQYLRLLAGLCLLGLSIRGRSSDLRRLHCLQLDLFEDPHGVETGYIEVLANRVKNAHTPEMKTSFLPMAGPASGLLSSFYQEPWVKYWLELREAAGLNPLPVIRDVADGRSLEPVVVLPRRDAAGYFVSNCPVTSDDVSRGLRQILAELQFDVDCISKISSHSLKATFLAWCAKFGIHKDHRRLLGYHADSNDKSVLTYSRDALAHPLRELDRVLAGVVDGSFVPSATRSGRFFDEPTALVDRFFAPDADVLEGPDLEDQPPIQQLDQRSTGEAETGWSLCGEPENDGFGLGSDDFDTHEPFAECDEESDDGVSGDFDLAPPDDWIQVRPSEGTTPKAPSPAVLLKPSPKASPGGDRDERGDTVSRSLESSFILEESSDSESSSSSASNYSDMARELASAMCLRSMPRSADKRKILRHDNGRYHLGRLMDPSRLACGKLMNSRYHEISELPDFLTPVCETCFGNEITKHLSA